MNKEKLKILGTNVPSLDLPTRDKKEAKVESEKLLFHGIEIPNVLVAYRRNEMFDSTIPEFLNKLEELGYNIKTLVFDRENTPNEIKEIVLQNEGLLKVSPLKFFDGTVKKEYENLKEVKGKEFARLDVYDDYENSDSLGLINLDEIYKEATEKEALNFIGVYKEKDIFDKIESVKKEEGLTKSIEFEGKILIGLLKQVKEKPEFAYVCKNRIDSHIKFESPEDGLKAVIEWLKEGGINAMEFDNSIKTTERDWVVSDRHNNIREMNLQAKLFELPIPDFVEKLFQENLIDVNPKTAIISKLNDKFNIEALLYKWSGRGFYVTEEQRIKMIEEIKKEEREKS